MNTVAARTLEAGVRNQPGIALIDLRGEINGFAEEALNRAYTHAEQDDPRAVVLNFNEVDYINSTGIALIVGLLARARQGRRRLLVYGLSDHYQEIFAITRLSDFLTVFPDEASALAGEGIAVGG
jgi:anti-sigma B factor antagonist